MRKSLQKGLAIVFLITTILMGEGVTMKLFSGTMMVDLIEIPLIATIPANGIYCANAVVPGVTIMLDTSQAGIEYKLFKNGNFTGMVWIGDGNAHVFGSDFLAGAYHITASNTVYSVSSPVLTVTAANPPVSEFTFPGNTASTCASTPVQFSDNSTPVGSITSWQWYFDDPLSGSGNQSQQQNPQHLFEAIGNSASAFFVQLIVTDNQGCQDSAMHMVNIKQKPDATLLEENSAPGTHLFSYCAAVPPLTDACFGFLNGSTTVATNTGYSLSFGECSLPAGYTNPTFTDTVDVCYSCQGYQPILFTVTGQNGCSNTGLYQSYVGSAPAGGITAPPDLYSVAPFTVTFEVDPVVYDNSPSTVYTMDFGDGSIATYNEESIPPTGIIHTYTQGSINQLNCTPGSPLQHAFKARFTAENPCGNVLSEVCPIIVSRSSAGNFTVAQGSGGQGWFPGDTASDHLTGCQTVEFSNLSLPGVFIESNGTSYSTEQHYLWNFGDPASGDNNTSTLPNPVHHYTGQAMIGIVTIVTWTGTSVLANITADTAIKQIYIQTPPVADFTTDYPPPAGNFVPLVVKVTNQSNTGGLGIPQYKWRILNATNGTLVTNGYSIITPGHEGDATWPDPWFQFNRHGHFNLEMIITNACTSDTMTQLIVVTSPISENWIGSDQTVCIGIQPELLTGSTPVCVNGDFSYQWEFQLAGSGYWNNANVSTKDYQPGPLNESTFYRRIVFSPGYSDTSNIVIVFISQTTVSAGPDQAVCMNTPVQLNGAINTGATEGIWMGGQGTYTPNRTTLNAIYHPLQVEAGMTVVLTLMSTNSLCGQNGSDSLHLNIGGWPYSGVAGVDQDICAGVPPIPLSVSQPTGGSGSYSYSWQQWDNSGWSYIAGATGMFFSPEALSETKKYRVVQTDLVCTPFLMVYSNVVTITTHELTGSLTIHDTIENGRAVCRSSGEIIASNPDDAFVVQSGGSATLSGMQAIRLMPGTMVFPGGYLNATVTTCMACSQQKMTEAGTNGEKGNQENSVMTISKPEESMILYPNPSDDYFSLVLPELEIGALTDLSIYNSRGELWRSETFENLSVNRFSLSGLPPGIYFIRCITSTGALATGKFIKR